MITDQNRKQKTDLKTAQKDQMRRLHIRHQKSQKTGQSAEEKIYQKTAQIDQIRRHQKTQKTDQNDR